MKDNKSEVPPVVFEETIELGGEQPWKAEVHIYNTPEDKGKCLRVSILAKDDCETTNIPCPLITKRLKESLAKSIETRLLTEILSKLRVRIGDPPFGIKDVTYGLPYLSYMVVPRVQIYGRVTEESKDQCTLSGTIELTPTPELLLMVLKEGQFKLQD